MQMAPAQWMTAIDISTSLRLTTRTQRAQQVNALSRADAAPNAVSPGSGPHGVARGFTAPHHPDRLLGAGQVDVPKSPTNCSPKPASQQPTLGRRFPQPDVVADPTLVRHTDLVLALTPLRTQPNPICIRANGTIWGSVVYVTGAHAFKAGLQWSIARDGLTTEVNLRIW